MNYIIKTNNRHKLFDAVMDHIKKIDYDFYYKEFVFHEVDYIIFFMGKFFKGTKDEIKQIKKTYRIKEISYNEWNQLVVKDGK